MNSHPIETILEKRREISRFDRILLAPACVHYDVLATCPQGDLAMLRKLAGLQWLSAVWACVLVASAFKIIGSGEWEPHQIALAILVTSIVVIADACVFIAAAHHAHGIARLEETGQFTAHRTTATKIRTYLLIASRFAMALVVVNFLAVIAGLAAFANDVVAVLRAEYQRANAALSLQVSDLFETEIKRIGIQIADLGASIGDGQKEQRRLRATIVEPTADEPEMRLALDRVAHSEAARAEADSALIAAQTESANQVGGTCRGRNCKPGRGPLWRKAQELIAAAADQVARAERALAAALAKLRELQAARAGEMRRKVEDAKLRLAEVSADTQAQESRFAALNASYQSRLANRERLIREAVLSDPRHVPQNEGLVARLGALRELMQQPSVAALIFLIEGVLIFLELAAVIGVTIHAVPMAYTLKVAERAVLDAHMTATRLSEALGRNGPASAPDAKALTQPDAPSIVPPQPAPATPPAGARMSPKHSSRHAPRWRPPSGSAGSVASPEDDEPPSPPSANGKAPSSSSAA